MLLLSPAVYQADGRERLLDLQTFCHRRAIEQSFSQQSKTATENWKLSENLVFGFASRNSASGLIPKFSENHLQVFENGWFWLWPIKYRIFSKGRITGRNLSVTKFSGASSREPAGSLSEAFSRKLLHCQVSPVVVRLPPVGPAVFYLRDAGAVVSYIASLLMLRLDLVTCMFRGWVFFVHVSCLVLITPFVCVGLICICAVVRFSLRCCFVSVSTSFSFFTARQGFQVSTWVCLKLS